MSDQKQIIPKEEIVTTLTEIIEDATYKMGKAKTNAARNHSKRAIAFWGSIIHHLKEDKKNESGN